MPTTIKFQDNPIHACKQVPDKTRIYTISTGQKTCPFCGEIMDYRKEEFADGKGRERHGSPIFYKLLEEMAETHDRKSHDYADNSNPYGNYHFAGRVANLFSHSPEDAGFAGRIAEKIYRLAILEGGNKTPENESVDDTERDIATIVTLWMSDRRNRRKYKNSEQIDHPSERALSKMINLEVFLTNDDKQQMISYLMETIRANEKRSNVAHKTEFPSQTQPKQE